MKEYTLNECFDLIRNGASIKQFKASGIPITRIETISSGIIVMLIYLMINIQIFI